MASDQRHAQAEPTGLEHQGMAWPPHPYEVAHRPTGEPHRAGRSDACSRFGLRREVLVPWLRPALETVALAVVLTFFFRQVVQPRLVDGSSMEPTLHTGQRVLISPLAHRLLGHPRRGDIVVFEAWERGEPYIKRIVGEPGDTVSIHAGVVRVNDQPLAEPYLSAATRGDHGPTTLATDEYYVLGDNRADSADSRYFGPLPATRIIGPVLLSLWPPGLLPVPDGS